MGGWDPHTHPVHSPTITDEKWRGIVDDDDDPTAAATAVVFHG